jgi:hypothetical protein
MGILASSGHGFLRNSYPSRQILVSVLPCLCRRDDRNEGADRLDLHEHEQRSDNPVDACKLDGIAGRFQPSSSEPCTGGTMVCSVRCGTVVHGCSCTDYLREAPSTRKWISRAGKRGLNRLRTTAGRRANLPLCV